MDYEFEANDLMNDYDEAFDHLLLGNGKSYQDRTARVNELRSIVVERLIKGIEQMHKERIARREENIRKMA